MSGAESVATAADWQSKLIRWIGQLEGCAYAIEDVAFERGETNQYGEYDNQAVLELGYSRLYAQHARDRLCGDPFCDPWTYLDAIECTATEAAYHLAGDLLRAATATDYAAPIVSEYLRHWSAVQTKVASPANEAKV